jgi:hypothetical protein
MPLFSFSGHETFPLRFNWLTKAVELVRQDPRILNSDEAIAEFGVGKNMVRAIKHWGLATGVLENADEARGAVVVTDLGGFLFGESAADPYCEDTATLWLLHWMLCRSPERATLWHFIFGHWRGNTLDLHSIQSGLAKWLDEKGGDLPSTSTLKRDLQCLLNTYIASQAGTAHLEDVVSCPLATLGLLSGAGGMVYRSGGRQSGLPAEIFAFAVLDYWKRVAPGTETIAVQEILERRASPGQIFLLGEDQAFELVSQIEAFDDAPFGYNGTAGLRQLYRTSSVTPEDMLARYYRTPYVHSADATLTA